MEKRYGTVLDAVCFRVESWALLDVGNTQRIDWILNSGTKPAASSHISRSPIPSGWGQNRRKIQLGKVETSPLWAPAIVKIWSELAPINHPSLVETHQPVFEPVHLPYCDRADIANQALQLRLFTQ